MFLDHYRAITFFRMWKSCTGKKAGSSRAIDLKFWPVTVLDMYYNLMGAFCENSFLFQFSWGMKVKPAAKIHKILHPVDMAIRKTIFTKTLHKVAHTRPTNIGLYILYIKSLNRIKVLQVSENFDTNCVFQHSPN